MSHYNFQKYTDLARWVSYWHQIDEVLLFNPKSLLIIGKGDGIVGEVLARYIQDIKTLDIEPGLRPDIVASVERIPLSDESVDIVLCAEVLEHLPFEKFRPSLNELRRVSKHGIVISLPHFGPPVKIGFKIPFLKERRFALKLPFPVGHVPSEHYWEIGKRGYAPSKIRRIIKGYFNITKEFVPFENQYHRFFILTKKRS